MNALHTTIEQIRLQLTTALDGARTSTDLEHIRVQFLGRNGHIAQLMEQLKKLPVEEKRTAGPALNTIKKWAQEQYEHHKIKIDEQAHTNKQAQAASFDVTAYRPHQLKGSLHVHTLFIEQLEQIFTSMGYTITDGPELETDRYNFSALNVPEHHPARDSHDTFWVNLPDMLLRTQTSTIQIHAMEKLDLPLAIFSHGRVYRNEATDASHDFMFMQGEGVLIDKNVSIANLLATAQTFLRALFNKEITLRVRPGYFPFVEPGLEIDASCPFCTDGCSTCKKTGWIELMGGGLIHPNVLRACNIDPEIYSGFAFGFGVNRLEMIKYGIDDIRLFHSDKIAFLDQF